MPARKKRPAWFKTLVATYEVLYPDLGADDPVVGWRRKPPTGFVWKPGERLVLGSRPPFEHETLGLDLGPFGPLFAYRLSHLAWNGYGIEVDLTARRPQALLVPLSDPAKARAVVEEPPPPYPLRLGSTRAFSRVAKVLREAGFTESRVTSAFGLADMSDLLEVTPERIDAAPLDASLLLLFRLFLFGQQRTVAEAGRLLGTRALDDLLALDLLVKNGWGDHLHSPVWLYPVEGLLIASDRMVGIDGAGLSPDPDAVFPAIDSSSLHYLEAVRGATGARALDVAGGTGVAAIALARRGARATTTDLNPRAAHLARFNARLNGVDVESLVGSLFDPVAGRKFDLIVGHPPYVPGDPTLNRGGGRTGEAVTRRLIREIPRHLARGGVARLLCVGLDTENRPFERRLRSWLSRSSPEVDVRVVPARERPVPEFLERRAAAGEDVAAMKEAFAAARATRLVQGIVALRRHARPRRATTRRLPVGSGLDFQF